MRTLDEETLVAEFTATASACLGPRRISVSVDDSCSTLLGTTWTGTEITLGYHPRFLDACPDVRLLRAALKHEICHPLTAPSPALLLPQGLPPAALAALVSYLDLFREFLAHQEFARRFPEDIPAMCEWLTLTFRPHQALGRVLLRSSDDFYKYLGRILSAYYDAIFFHIIGDEHFRHICERAGKAGLYIAFVLAMEDISLIASQPESYDQKLDLVEQSFFLFANLDVDGLQNGRLCLAEPLDIATAEVDGRLRAAWSKRALPLAPA